MDKRYSRQGEGQKPPRHQPRLGIFWLIRGKLVLDSTPFEDAEDDGIFKMHPFGHLERWEILRQIDEVPRDSEYEDYPRGRVVYERLSNEFRIFADQCILKDRDVMKRIVRKLNLPGPKSGFQVARSDTHYRCLKCLRHYPARM